MPDGDFTGLQVDSVDVPRVRGRLGLCACPGGRQALITGVEPEQDLMARDLEAIRRFGASGLVSLVERREFDRLGLHSLPVELRRTGLWWRHLPITDMGVPDRGFEARWENEGAWIRDALSRGEHVVLHCWAGLGRTGTIAARVLVEFGMEPEAAILRVRTARPGSIQTRRQEKYVLKLKPLGR